MGVADTGAAVTGIAVGEPVTGAGVLGEFVGFDVGLPDGSEVVGYTLRQGQEM